MAALPLYPFKGDGHRMVQRVTNARAEGINSGIQWVKCRARGYRNRQRLRDAIYFHFGGLDV